MRLIWLGARTQEIGQSWSAVQLTASRISTNSWRADSYVLADSFTSQILRRLGSTRLLPQCRSIDRQTRGPRRIRAYATTL